MSVGTKPSDGEQTILALVGLTDHDGAVHPFVQQFLNGLGSASGQVEAFTLANSCTFIILAPNYYDFVVLYVILGLAVLAGDVEGANLLLQHDFEVQSPHFARGLVVLDPAKEVDLPSGVRDECTVGSDLLALVKAADAYTCELAASKVVLVNVDVVDDDEDPLGPVVVAHVDVVQLVTLGAVEAVYRLLALEQQLLVKAGRVEVVLLALKVVL